MPCLGSLSNGLLCFPQIKLWDLRTTKCIRQYEGHVNEYAYLPLHVHEEEGIVVAGTWGREALSVPSDKMAEGETPPHEN